jgi:putative tricarboxylic transport membrane protein
LFHRLPAPLGEEAWEEDFSKKGEYMKNRDLLSSIVCLVFGGLFVAGSLWQGLFLKGIPGPGFLPFLTGIALMLLSLAVLIPAARSSKEKALSSGLFLEEAGSLKKVLLALVALVGYVLIMDIAGYLITSFLFMLFTSRLLEPTKWWVSFIMALATTILTYILFVVVMEIQLPRGLLHF